MKLYLKPGACSLATHIVLEELGLPYATEEVDLRTKQTASGQDFLAINPKGYVPALLLDSGDVLTEGPAVLQYLADLVPEKHLAPPNGSLPRYQLQAWLGFIGTELHKSFSPFFNPALTPDWKVVSLAHLERRLTTADSLLNGRAYTMGDDFTVADAYLFVVLGWARVVPLDLSRWPNLVAFTQRVAVRPAVQAALKAEGLA